MFTFTTTSKYFLVLALPALCLLPFGTSAQEAGSPRVERVMAKISFVNPAIGLEFALNKKMTVATQAALGFAYTGYASTNGVNGSYSVLFPMVRAEFRNYYSLERRAGKGKNWRGNSSAFFGLSTSYRFNALSERTRGNILVTKSYQPAFSVGPVWGIQLTEIKSHFNFSFSIGPALSLLGDDSAEFSFFGGGHVNLGFVIGNFSKS
jgi:hypothetical protein